jgi:hypothetical protein
MLQMNRKWLSAFRRSRFVNTSVAWLKYS